MSLTTYLAGPTVCGFHGMFDADFGTPETPTPYCRITPSRIGNTLLPFRCPRCQSVIDFSDPTEREHYHDTRVVNGKKRDNYWCQNCGNRFLVNLIGKRFEGKFDDHAAPSTVECITVGVDGLVDVKRVHQGVLGSLFQNYLVGTDVLGCC